MDRIPESAYPVSFREKDAKELGEHIRNRHTVVLIGMKRVGINSFLRFFIYHQKIKKTYVGETGHIFIPVDLNDLVERELFPFWTLTFKRILDVVTTLEIEPKIKKEIENLFLDGIQSKDLFLLIDGVRKSLMLISAYGYKPTIFFLRFDRMAEAATTDFFSNLQGLKDATNRNLSYVFTSFRPLDYLSPEVFTKSSVSVFAHDMYLKPAERKDMKIIFETFKDLYKLNLPEDIEKEFLRLVDGYVQYLHYGVLFLNENKIKDKNELEKNLPKDERIILQSEEIWESLNSSEKDVLKKTTEKKQVHEEEKENSRYIWETGILYGGQIFSPLFETYVKDRKDNESQEFTKKENLLFSFLLDNKGNICEREDIIKAVWKDEEEFGITDWAIDRLMARVRAKLKNGKTGYEIQTIKTRGFKLITV